jgi:hypothetical protein
MFRFCLLRQRRRVYGGWQESPVKSLSDDTSLFRLGQGYLCFLPCVNLFSLVHTLPLLSLPLVLSTVAASVVVDGGNGVLRFTGCGLPSSMTRR